MLKTKVANWIEDGPLLSVKEAAQILNVSPRTLYTLSKEEDFPIIHVSERRVVVPRGALLKWIGQKNAISA